MQNGCCESFNGRMRDELLNETLFFGPDHAREKVSAWVSDYTTGVRIRPSVTQRRRSMRQISPQ
jgi:hypothetical protein